MAIAFGVPLPTLSKQLLCVLFHFLLYNLASPRSTHTHSHKASHIYIHQTHNHKASPRSTPHTVLKRLLDLHHTPSHKAFPRSRLHHTHKASPRSTPPTDTKRPLDLHHTHSHKLPLDLHHTHSHSVYIVKSGIGS
jgi:hypothetical protein